MRLHVHSEEIEAWHFLQTQWPAGRAPSSVARSLALTELGRRGIDARTMSSDYLESMCSWALSSKGMMKTGWLSWLGITPKHLKSGAGALKAAFLSHYFFEAFMVASDMFGTNAPECTIALNTPWGPPLRRDWPELYRWGACAKKLAPIFAAKKGGQAAIWHTKALSPSEIEHGAISLQAEKRGLVSAAEYAMLACIARDAAAMTQARKFTRWVKVPSTPGWRGVWRSFKSALELDEALQDSAARPASPSRRL